MNNGRSRRVPNIWAAVAFTATGLAAGCVSPPDPTAVGAPSVVTGAASAGKQADKDSERRAALAEMRAKAEAGDAMPFPDAFQTAQTARLAARPEPKPLDDVAALELELAGIGRRQQGAVSADELAGLKAREAELRRLLAAARAGNARP